MSSNRWPVAFEGVYCDLVLVANSCPAPADTVLAVWGWISRFQRARRKPRSRDFDIALYSLSSLGYPCVYSLKPPDLEAIGMIIGPSANPFGRYEIRVVGFQVSDSSGSDLPTGCSRMMGEGSFLPIRVRNPWSNGSIFVILSR